MFSRVLHKVSGVRGPISNQLRQLWAYRWQIWIDLVKDLTSENRETLGRFLWVVGLPLAPLGIYLFLARLRVFAPHDSMQGVVYVVIGATLWFLFTSIFLAPLYAIKRKGKMASQSRYPLIAAVATAVGQAWIEFCIRVLLCAFVLFATQHPSPVGALLLLPVVFSLSLMFLGSGLVLGIFAVAWKDLEKLVPILISYGFFLSNVLFPMPTAVIPQALIWSNPFAFSIDTARWVLMFGEFPNFPIFILWFVIGLVLVLKALHFLDVSEQRLAANL